MLDGQSKCCLRLTFGIQYLAILVSVEIEVEDEFKNPMQWTNPNEFLDKIYRLLCITPSFLDESP